MSAFVYANGQYHLLAGNKIVKDAALLEMKSADKIIVNGQSYNLGAATTSIPEVPDAPVLDDMVHNNGTEPSTGTKWYVTPDGAGSMDGTSWANAASQSQIHVILLSAASGDSIYFAEGDYTTDRTLTLPSGVSLFGGFPSENPSWETRNAFTHQTVWTASHSGAWLASTSNVTGQLVDGFAIMNYTGTTKDGQNLIFRNMTLSGGNFTTAGKLENCYVTGVTLNAGSVSSSKAVNSPAAISNAEGTDFFYAYVEVYIKAENCNVYGTEESKVNCRFSGTATNCTVINCMIPSSPGSIFSCKSIINCKAINCSGSGRLFDIQYIEFSSGRMTNCTAVNFTGKAFIFYSYRPITNCTAVNCTSEAGDIFTTMSNDPITNCTAVNCRASKRYIFSGGPYINCTAVNCYTGVLDIFCANGVKITNCTAVNCMSYRSLFYTNSSSDPITNCTAVNCTSKSDTFHTQDLSSPITNCTAVNCTSESNIFNARLSPTINCLSWNNDGTEFSNYTNLTTCAGSTYNSALALTLGTDNSIARFTNTGFAPAKGMQDVGECPSPVDDPDGYAEWLSAFGDWHPAADSFLLGAGTADEDVTTDADGVTRPDPPSIGAFEAKPAS